MSQPEWKCIATDGMPSKLGHSCYAVWNGSYWLNASLLMDPGGPAFYDYNESRIKRASHYIYIGNGPDDQYNAGVTP